MLKYMHPEMDINVAYIVAIVVLVATNSTVNGKRNYLYPLIPFNGKALLSLCVRVKKKSK